MMRLVHAAALTAAALLLASVASAQGLGDAAARERDKRKATPAKPAKVYTESDIGRSMPPVETTQDQPATAEGQPAAAGQPAAEGQAPAEGQPAAEGQAPAEGQAAEGAAAPDAAAKAAAEAAKAEDEARAKAVENWKKRLEQARKEEAVYKDVVDRLQVELNDNTGTMYSPGRAAKIQFQEENKKKLAETQGKIAALEEEGRRNRYQ